ncbi:hypothetical protein EP47_04845 [Legionella norrlandica]|uniref:Flagellar hook protein FlgE n=1 Tax=Legionella norrlandica TaxID=1498499 RepID=A0A0A2T8D6_9GAMM|nr:flagellar hook protein FlgE [Legionella norrlandica]KGP63693.1 hypothetical protein EP47_04845 [Legionella norrlandica]
MGIGSIATTGLQAALSHMEAISNNIANVNTIGYKKSYINFADIYSSNGTSNHSLGMGTRIKSVNQDFSLGRIETSQSGLDVSLARDGFMIQRNPANGLVSYTRCGRLNFDNQGYLVGYEGILQGYPAINGVLQTSAKPVDLQFPNSPLAAQATTSIDMSVNLDSNANIISSPFNANDPSTYNFRSDQTIYDSLGNSYLASLFYVKTADNSWTTQVSVDNQIVGNGTLSFTNSGALSSVTGLSGLNWAPINGAAPGTFNISLNNSTQYAGDSKTYDHNQDGYPSGTPVGCNLDENGCLNIAYSNGISRIEGQIAVARFKSNQGLARSENMSWLPTSSSGEPILDSKASDSGFIVGSVEYSNVDLTEELVNLISAQHDFQANAQAQQTYNQVLQTIEKI